MNWVMGLSVCVVVDVISTVMPEGSLRVMRKPCIWVMLRIAESDWAVSANASSIALMFLPSMKVPAAATSSTSVWLVIVVSVPRQTSTLFRWVWKDSMKSEMSTACAGIVSVCAMLLSCDLVESDVEGFLGKRVVSVDTDLVARNVQVGNDPRLGVVELEARLPPCYSLDHGYPHSCGGDGIDGLLQELSPLRSVLRLEGLATLSYRTVEEIEK